MKENFSFEIPDEELTLLNAPIECFFRDNYEYGNCSSLHWHFDSEIIYVNEGAQEITVGNNIVRLNRGDLIYINPQQIHLAYSCSSKYTALTVLKFDTAILKSASDKAIESEFLSPFLDQAAIQSMSFTASQIEQTEIPTLLQEILAEQKEREYGFEYAMRNKVCGVILALMRELKKSNQVIFRSNRINEIELERFNNIMRYINENFRSEILIEDILSLCSLSYSNFAVKFKSLTGKTLTEYINHVRISYAQQMLITTKVSVTEIANLCGFNDVCYFSRVFKKLLEKSPYEFRKSGVLT